MNRLNRLKQTNENTPVVDSKYFTEKNALTLKAKPTTAKIIESRASVKVSWPPEVILHGLVYGFGNTHRAFLPRTAHKGY